MRAIFHVLFCGACLAGFDASAQEFPEQAQAPSAAELQRHMAGKTFEVKLADGGSWRVQYKANGYFYLNTSQGMNDSGDWRAEDGRLCSKGMKIGSSCNEVRMAGEVLLLKRDSGEIVQFLAR
ncbi:hypothetical protein [Paucibacter soli]|uniref:hypothetical protein n=1 Tax=Paucibacter soli TaxID=3133433 RepID=UPI0030AE892B